MLGLGLGLGVNNVLCITLMRLGFELFVSVCVCVTNRMMVGTVK